MQTLLPLYRACIYFFYSEKITIFLSIRMRFCFLFSVQFIPVSLHGSRPVRNCVEIIQGSRLLTPT